MPGQRGPANPADYRLPPRPVKVFGGEFLLIQARRPDKDCRGQGSNGESPPKLPRMPGRETRLQGTSDTATGAGTVGKLVYAAPVFEKIVRQATAGMAGLRLEPMATGRTPSRILFWRPRLKAYGAGRRLSLTVPFQVARGWPIPALADHAQKVIAAEVRRLTDYEEVTVNLRVSGLFPPDEGGAP